MLEQVNLCSNFCDKSNLFPDLILFNCISTEALPAVISVTFRTDLKQLLVKNLLNKKRGVLPLKVNISRNVQTASNYEFGATLA